MNFLDARGTAYEPICQRRERLLASCTCIRLHKSKLTNLLDFLLLYFMLHQNIFTKKMYDDVNIKESCAFVIVGERPMSTRYET